MRKYSLLLLLAAAACSDSPTGPNPVEPVRSDTIEARALWVSRFEYATASDIVQIFADAKKANFNIVYFQVRGNSDALYRSNVDPCSTRLCFKLGGSPTWDPLETAAGEAMRNGIQVHAWINAFIAWNTSCSSLVTSDAGKPNHILIDHPDWLMVDSLGVMMQCGTANWPDGNGWVSPGIPGVRTHLARVAADIVRNYPIVAGVHLDFIRYPGRKWSWDQPSLAAFGKDPKLDRPAWDQFRRDQVSAAVSEVYDSVVATRPSAVLSAAVWGIYGRVWSTASSGFLDYYQDPRAWANAHKLDVAVPMTYWRIRSGSCSDFTDWLCLLNDHVTGFQASGRHVYIGMYADLGATEMINEITRGRDRGAQGFSVFSYTSARSTNLFDSLRVGVFRLPAKIPTMSWK